MSFNIKTIGNDGIVGNHPDVTSWLNTISLVGGSASNATIAALNTFCNSIDSAGLRNKFYRLNLFCGNNLNSCLVPLYVNTQWNSPVLGFSIDTNNNFVSGDYNETGVNGGLIGNGTNKFLLTGLIGTTLSAGNRHLSAYERTSATTDYSPSLGTTDGNAIQHAIGPWTASTNYFYRTHNTIGGNANTTKSVGFWLGSDSSSTASVLYRNGVSAASTSSQSAGGSPSIQYAIFGTVTSSNAISEASEVRLGAYSIGLSLNSSEVSSFHTIMQIFQAALGRAIPQVVNVDAQSWIDRVYANGGTVSVTTAAAVNTFCNTIDMSGIRNRFLRLNLMCGDNLAACLVPLYRGESLGGTQFGNTTDTNNGPFVSGDYVETGTSGGLRGNGTTKYLDTGFLGNTLATGNRHLSVYESLRDTNTFKAMIGVQDDGAGTYYFTLSNFTPGTRVFASFQAQAASPDGQTTGAHWIATDPANNSLVLYRNATSVASSSSTARALPAARSIFVFATNNNPASIASPASHISSRLNAYSIGFGLDQTQATAYYNAMQTFQTSLGRNV
jgi:hypothetical protein